MPAAHQPSSQPDAGQRWDADAYARNGRFVASLGASLLDWLAPQAGERVLDLGCGDGVLTQRLADAGCVVVGADASEALVAAARQRGLDARLVDGHALAFHGEFDAVFSNAALHWMKRDPAAVIAGVYAALRPGGRFVAEMGGAGNVAAIRRALHQALTRRGLDANEADPWYFPDVPEYRALLQAAGFHVARIERYERPTPLPGDVGGWLTTFAQPFLDCVPAAEQAAFIDEVRDTLQPRLRGADGTWTADYVRLRFTAHKKDLT